MDLLLKKVRISDAESLMDVEIANGKIVAVAPEISQNAASVIEADGCVLIPGLIESHLHLDKALIANRKPNRSGTLQEAIAVTAELKPTFTTEDVRERAEKTLRIIIRHGITHLRTHSEFDPAGGFTGFKVIMELKEKYKDVIDIQVVAFPQEGILKAPGTEAMMHEAVAMGADVVGGIPYNDLSATEHIDLVFEIAKKYQKPLDWHQDFKDGMEGASIEYLCKKTIAEGYQGRVSVGHLTSLGAFPPDQLQPVMELIAKAQISVMCLPATDLHLGGRQDTHNVRRALTPVRALKKAGVNVCIGSNNIRNAFTPFGNGDIFQIAMLAVPAAHLGGADDLPGVLPMITCNPAKALGLQNYGLQEGCQADMVLLDTKVVGEAIIDLPEKLFVIKRGRVIVENTRESRFKF
jgi:cytosine deaminase